MHSVLGIEPKDECVSCHAYSNKCISKLRYDQAKLMRDHSNDSGACTVPLGLLCNLVAVVADLRLMLTPLTLSTVRVVLIGSLCASMSQGMLRSCTCSRALEAGPPTLECPYPGWVQLALAHAQT